MNFKVSTAKEALSTFGESSFIAASGIYDVTIKFASVDVSKGGAESVNFNVDYNGNDVTLYGPYVTNKDGATNEIGAKLINSLAVKTYHRLIAKRHIPSFAGLGRKKFQSFLCV